MIAPSNAGAAPARPDRPGLVNVSRLRSRAAAPRASRRVAPPHHPENAMTDIDPHELVSRYVAVWNQADAELRRKAIHDLWPRTAATSSSHRRRCGRPPQG